MSEIGHNGGPKVQRFTAKAKVERIKEVLDMDISAAQKCIGIRIIADADTDGLTPELSTEDLKRSASVKDHETVYRATRKLDEKKVAKKFKEEGRPNRYLVLPSEAIDAVLDEIDAASPVASEPPPPTKSDGVNVGLPLRSERTTPSDETGVVRSEQTGSNRTTPIETDPSEPATPAEPDALAPVASRARAEYNNINKTNPYQIDRGEEKDRGCGGKEKDGSELALEDEQVSSLDLQALEAFNLYNEMALRCCLSQAARLTPARKKLIIARLKEYGAPSASGLEAWRIALGNVEKSAYLRGNGGGRPGWKADLDFLLQASKFTKVVEGGYGNGAHAENDPRRSVTDRDRIAEIMRDLEQEERSKRSGYGVAYDKY